MRVLHLLDPAVPRRNDYTRRTLALLGQLRAQGVQTVQLTASPATRSVAAATCHAADGQAWHFYRTAAPWSACARVRGLGALAGHCRLAWRLRQVARLTRPDLIHVHAPGNNALAALPVARLARLPLVVDAERRAAGAAPMAALERFALDRVDMLAAGSLEQRLALRGAGLLSSRIAVIPPAPDLDLAPVARRPFGVEGAPLIVYAGPLGREDGLDLLLSVLPRLRRQYPALRLLVAGGGVREAELAERLRAPGLRGHGAVTGRLPCRRAADLLARADIAVFPALPGAHALLP